MQQKEDSYLLGWIQDLENGGTGGEHVTDDYGLLYNATLGSFLRMAIPRSLVHGILALLHTAYGYPEVAQTIELVQRKFYYTSLKYNVRDCVPSCGCRTIRRLTSQRVAKLLAGFLKPWLALELDIHGMGARSEAGN